MNTLLRMLTNRWLISILGLIFLALLIWFLGEFLGFGAYRPLESPTSRVVLIAAVVTFWAIRKLIQVILSSKAEKHIVEGIVEPSAGDGSAEMSAEEIEVLKERFEDAVGVLKKSRGKHGKHNLYQLPWYIIIGPPGSGKTTALLNSGLDFPLADRFGREAVQGVGGTRNCDWWFTDQAILIDTAGRYVTQDSHAEVDRAVWSGFLDLLKKYRKRRPINGVFVAISVSDLMTQEQTERRLHVHAIRQRLEELDQHFGIRFPIYVMLTKCDLIAGFSEFFENLGRDDREQVWGMTFALEDRSSERSPITAFEAEYDALVKRLNERLLWRLGQERDVARRAMIYRFPKQMASLKEVLSGFLGEVFQASRYNDAALVRGVYLCSGTQEGAPVDRMLGVLAQTFGLSTQAVPTPQGPGKSYFISDLLQKVAFQESEVAGTNRRLERQRAWLQRAAYVGAAVVTGLAIFAWVLSFARNSSYIETVAGAAAQAETLTSDISPRDLDPLGVLPALDAVRDLAHRNEDSSIRSSLLQGFGLSQAGKLRDVGEEAYRRMLTDAFLPRIMLRMEARMRGGGPSREYTYAALRAYLSLDSREHYDADMINAFLSIDWLENLSRETSTEERTRLQEHLTALLERQPLQLPLPLDDALVRAVQVDLRRMPLDERIYSRLLTQPIDTSISGFNIREGAGGDAAEFVFVRKSGAALSEALPPLFTKAGYQNVFKSTSRNLADELLRETWVLGREEQVSDAEMEVVLERVRERYLEDFARRYTDLILDIELAPFSTADEAARIFRILSQDDSPLLLLLEELERQTALDAIAEGPVDQAESSRLAVLQRTRELIQGGSAQSAVGATIRQANLVEERFERLTGLVRQVDGRPRPIDHLLELIGRLYVFMSTISSEQAGGAIPPHVVQQGQALIQELRIEAQSQPDLVSGLLGAATSRTSVLAFGGLRAHLNSMWRSGPLPFCHDAIEGRYPISRSSGNVIRIDDFSRFFGYNQMMELFFNEHLRQYVDTSSRPWRLRRTGSVPIDLSSAALQAFERADAIKQTFFSFGGVQPTVGFNLTPVDMDAALGRLVLNLEGQEISWEHGPQVPMFMQWPGPNPGSEVRIEMRNAASGRSHMMREQGPWAWFRVLDRARIRPTGELEHFEIEFDVDGNKALFELVARSAYNPFRFEELERFSCPDSL